MIFLGEKVDKKLKSIINYKHIEGLYLLSKISIFIDKEITIFLQIKSYVPMTVLTKDSMLATRLLTILCRLVI